MKSLSSEIIKEFNFREADISGEDLTYTIDKNDIEKEILRIRKKNKISSEVPEVRKGDIAVCSLKSGNPKLNKESIAINVGLGLFEKKIEDELIGMTKGQDKNVVVDGINVDIKVLSITRREIPELNDEMVKKEKIDNITTANCLIAKLYEDQKNKVLDSKLYNLTENVIKQVIAKSKFDINEEDIEYLSGLEIQKARELAAVEGLTLETMTEDDFNGRIPVKSYKEFLKMVKNMETARFPVLLLGIYNGGRNGYKPSREEYEESIREYYTMYKLNPEDAKKAITFEYYESNQYQSYYREIIKNYYIKKYEEV
ncbi:hypothetical protein [Sporanaerobacter sp. PP17-6a]|uniref:hypothetical protein n=1 Tax=Sporanaerobacter sp. PP17-6a TaxID=1891289 RepID=UPI0008A08E4B|nr:hypothetical protein [Sporanaerobacter sp. PP17-6a]SCL85862.1 trigger factor [Sporanaerobacter sp. PP17-6a]